VDAGLDWRFGRDGRAGDERIDPLVTRASSSTA
jgi:hypothetical protein